MKTTTGCCTSSGGNAPDEARYDLAVIGAGSAGFSAAITAAEHGARVVLAGYGTIGGTCVNIGCVPSKALIRAAESIHQANSANRFGGIKASAGISDWSALMARKTELVTQLRQNKYEDLLPRYDKLTYLEGRAKPVDGGIELNGRHIKARKTIIATGSSPALPSIPGIENISCLTSTSALALETLPKSMIVMGGGVIGCELAQMFSRFGVKTTLICRSRLLPDQEPEISKALQRYLADEGINVICGAAYLSICQAHEIRLTYELTGKQLKLSAEHLLAATGRKPNLDGLDLDNLGIEYFRKSGNRFSNKKCGRNKELEPGFDSVKTGNALEPNPFGGIFVDAHMQTTHKNIYAAGDVTGRDMFVYMAAYGAKIAARNAVCGKNQHYDSRAMPKVIFTDPQVASVGLTEDRAKAQGFEVITSSLPLDALPRALAARDTRGLIKLVADARSNTLLGAHILAPEGADSIQCAALAIRQKLGVEELGDMIFPYLTNVEGLKLAAQGFSQDIAKLSCCAG